MGSRIWLLLVIALVQAVAVEDLPWEAALGPVDAEQVKRDAAQVRLTCPVVVNVNRNGPAERAGLRAGDVIVGLHGLRVVGSGEYGMVRWQHPDGERGMPLTVLRGSEVLTLEPKPWRYRTMGFGFDEHPESLVGHLVARAGLPRDAGTDPFGFRAWMQFPKRELLAILIWIGDGIGERDRSWLDALDRQHRALCAQDFAAAAAETVAGHPAELDDLVRLYAALAARHAEGEIEPDPGRHGLDLISWVRLYPYPVITGPPIGALPPEMQPMGELMERLQRHPAWLGGDYDNRSWFLPGMGRGNELSTRYMGSYGQALLDRKRHGGWPFRNHLLHQKESRDQMIAEFDAVQVPEDCRWYLDQVATIPRLMASSKRTEDWEAATSVLLASAERSPSIGFQGLVFLHNAQAAERMWNGRPALRGAFRAMDPQLWPKPSPWVERLRASDAWDCFYVPISDGRMFEEYLDRALVAARYERSIKDLEATIDGLGEDADLDQRIALIDEMVDRYSGWMTHIDLYRLSLVVGDGRAYGALLDRAPRIIREQERRPHCASFYNNLSSMTWPGAARDLDYEAVAAALAAVDWTDPSDAVERLYLELGNLPATQLIADACAAHGADALAARYRGRVVAYLDAAWHHAQSVGWSGYWKGRIAWLQLATYAASEATAARAIEAGQQYLKVRKKPEERWNCSLLSLAQAHLLRGDHAAAAESLALSFDGEEMETAERFPWPDGVLVIGEPAQRMAVLQRIADAGQLDGVRGGIQVAVDPKLVPEGFAALLGVDPTSLGVEPPPPGSDDF